MTENFSNNYSSALDGAIDDNDTSVIVLSESGSPAVNFRLKCENELMLVTAKGGTGNKTYTVTRGIEGTTAVAHADGTLVTHLITAEGLTLFRAEMPLVGCSLYNNTTQTITDSTDNIVTFNSENFDTHGFHSTVTNTGRITVPSGQAGYYLAGMNVVWDTNATGVRYGRIIKQGATIPGHGLKGTPGANTLGVGNSIVVPLSVGDRLEIVVWQNSGASRTIGSANTYETNGFWAFRIGA